MRRVSAIARDAECVFRRWNSGTTATQVAADTPNATRNGRLIHETRDPYPYRDFNKAWFGGAPSSAVLRALVRRAKTDIGSALHEYNATPGRTRQTSRRRTGDDIADRWDASTGKDRGFAGTCAADGPASLTVMVRCSDGRLCLRADGTKCRTTCLVGGWTSKGAYHGARRRDRSRRAQDIIFATQNWQARCPLLSGKKWTVVPARQAFTWTNRLLGCRRHGKRRTWPIPLRANGPRANRGRTFARFIATVMEQSERVEAGKLPKLVTGTHCTYCAARAGCPALVSETRAIVSGHSGLMAGPLTRRQAVKAAGLLGPARAAVKAMEDALRAHVEAFGEVPLPDGKVYGSGRRSRIRPTTRGSFTRRWWTSSDRSWVPTRRQGHKQCICRDEGQRFTTRDRQGSRLRGLGGRKTPLNALCRRRAWLPKTSVRWGAHYPKG